MARPSPFLRSLVEREGRFLLQEIAAGNHPELEIPIAGLGTAQAFPGELFVPRPGRIDHPDRLDRFIAQSGQLALAQFPDRERNRRLLVDDVPGQGPVDIDPFPPFIGPELHDLVPASWTTLLQRPLADRGGASRESEALAGLQEDQVELRAESARGRAIFVAA